MRLKTIRPVGYGVSWFTRVFVGENEVPYLPVAQAYEGATRAKIFATRVSNFPM